jgi:hypothetical protein
MTPFGPPPEPDPAPPPPDSITEQKPAAAKPKEPEPSLVTLTTFGNPQEAHMALNCLRSASIRAVLDDEMLLSNAWHLSNAMGGVKLLVREADAERAAKILANLPSKQDRPKKSGPELIGDEMASQALNWSTLGLFVLPIITHIVSSTLLLNLERDALPLSKEGKKKAQEARAINRMVFLLTGFMLLGLVGVVLLALAT